MKEQIERLVNIITTKEQQILNELKETLKKIKENHYEMYFGTYRILFYKPEDFNINNYVVTWELVIYEDNNNQNPVIIWWEKLWEDPNIEDIPQLVINILKNNFVSTIPSDRVVHCNHGVISLTVQHRDDPCDMKNICIKLQTEKGNINFGCYEYFVLDLSQNQICRKFHP